jgi:hypothetical protein
MNFRFAQLETIVKDSFSVFATRIGMLALLVSLVGCGIPSTISEAKKMPPERMVAFEIPIGYQTVYKRLHERMQECYEASGWSSGVIVVVGDLFTDSEQATITLKQFTGSGVNIWRHIEIAKIAGNKSNIRVYVGLGPVQSAVNLIKRWAEGSLDSCSL